MRQALPLTSPLSPVLANTNHLITHCLPKDRGDEEEEENHDDAGDDYDGQTYSWRNVLPRFGQKVALIARILDDVFINWNGVFSA